MKKTILFILAVLVVVLFFFIKTIFGCSISDKEAITKAKEFCSKMNVRFSQEPRIFDSHDARPILNAQVKEVAFGERGNAEIEIRINCRTRHVESFFNWGIRRQIKKKYNIPSVTTEPYNWPPFLSKREAKKIIYSFADKINIPADVEFYDLSLNKDDGVWRGWWIRKHNNYPYEKDGMGISILAVDGEFFSFGESFSGEPCPTEVEVSKEAAIEEGWRQIERLFSNVNWIKYKNEYAVTSADLKIVQPNVLFGRIVPFFSTKSRLAWTIVYELKKLDKNTVVAVDFKHHMTIKIDAATRKLLGGDYTK